MSAHAEFSSDDLEEELRALIKPELAPDERLLWAARGRPRSGGRGWIVAALWASAFWIVCMAAIAGSRMPTFRGFEGFLSIIGIVAGIIGFFFVVGIITNGISGRYERRRLKRAIYALTDRQAIVWKPQRSSAGIEIRKYPRGTISNVSRVEYPDGTGDVWFERETGSWTHPASPDEVPEAAGFEGVPEVRRVEELVRRTLLDSEM